MFLRRIGFAVQGPVPRGALDGALPLDERADSRTVKGGAAEEPWAIFERVLGLDHASFRRQSERACRNADESGGPAQVQPGRGSVRRLAEERNAIVGAQGGDALPRPAVTGARLQAVTVEKARDHVVSRDQRQRADGVNDVGGGAGALPASAARQSVLSVGASHPVQGQYDLSRAVVEIGDSFVDEGAYDPFLEPRVRRRGRPDRLEVRGERVERDRRKGGTGRGRIMVGDSRLSGGHAD